MKINNKKELRSVLNYERKRWNLHPINSWLGWMKMELFLMIHPGGPYLYMYCLRNLEYYNQRAGKYNLRRLYYAYKLRVLSLRTGIELSPGVAELGVKVNHGKCIISKYAKIGKDSVIVGFVTIGGIGGKRDNGAAIIGKRVFISSGVRIIGPVHIADDVVIGANAVVVKDITEPGITVAGVPAKIISDKGSEDYIQAVDM